jgi:hypothetical protein
MGNSEPRNQSLKIDAMRRLALILFLLALTGVASDGQTNYFCVVCGKGPLHGLIHMSKWGPVCDDCMKIEDRCSICGLPVRDDYVQTGDGRFICKFCKSNAVLNVEQARELFTEVRQEVVELYGQGFALQYPDVTVNLFDVDYWSEKGRSDGLHKFGFASTRKTANGRCTHEVALLSGRLRDEIAATAAHEYTHLWINENRPDDHVIDSDTVEAICELTAYKLMGSESLPDAQAKILSNPYTHGEIKELVAVEQERGVGYIMNWVKNGTTRTFEEASFAPTVAALPLTVSAAPPPLPRTLKLNGLLVDGQNRRAIINGISFMIGEEKQIKLQQKTMRVRCREIDSADVILDVTDMPGPVKLTMNAEMAIP